jgi:HAD superfamily hydrolase (TIGR01490 family)
MNLALFDLDHTLIPFDSNTAWMNFLIRAGVVDAEAAAIRNRAFARDYAAGNFDAHAYHRFTAGLLAPHERAVLDRWREAFTEEIALERRAEFDTSRVLVERHRANGDLCCVVTATNRFLAQVFATIFGIDHLVATEAATLHDGPDARFSGEVSGDPCFGASKVDHVECWLSSLGYRRASFDRTYFYSDSWNDLPLLRWADEAVAVNPDPKLRAEALAKGWRILDLDWPARAKRIVATP